MVRRRVNALEVILTHRPVSVIAPQAGDAPSSSFLTWIEPLAFVLAIYFSSVNFRPDPRAATARNSGGGGHRTFRTCSWFPCSKDRGRYHRPKTFLVGSIPIQDYRCEGGSVPSWCWTARFADSELGDGFLELPRLRTDTQPGAIYWTYSRADKISRLDKPKSWQ